MDKGAIPLNTAPTSLGDAVGSKQYQKATKKEKIMFQALEDILKVNDISRVKVYQRMEEIAREAIVNIKSMK